MAAVYGDGPPPPPPPPPPVPGPGGPAPGFGARPPQQGGGAATGMHGGPGGPGGGMPGRPFGGAGGMPPGGGPGGPGGPGGLGGGSVGLPQGRPDANTRRPMDHQLAGNATGPVSLSFHGWSFRKDREPGVEASWARARKTALPYSGDVLQRMVNRTTSPSGSSSSKKGKGMTVYEQYNSLRSPHQRALIDGLLEAVKGEERNPNAEWSLACIEQEVAEYIRKGFGKVREVREMRVVLRRGGRKDMPAAGPLAGDGLPGEIVDLIHGQGQGPHRSSQPSQPSQQQQPIGMGMGMGMGRGAAPGGGMPFGAAGGGGGAGGPGPFAAGGAPGGVAGGPGPMAGGFGRGAAMNPGGPPGGGAFHGGGGGGGGLPAMGPNINMAPPPPPPQPVPPMGPPRGGGFDGNVHAGHDPYKGQKAGKGPKSPRIIPESDFSDEFDDLDMRPEVVYTKPHKAGKGKKGVTIPRPPFPPSRSRSREGAGKSPKNREPELHRVPTIINNTIKIPRAHKGDRLRKIHSRPKYEHHYNSSSDEDHYILTPRSSDDETWSTSRSSTSGSSPGRYRRSRSKERHGYPPIRTMREHKKPAPQPRSILREHHRPSGNHLVDAEGYYEHGGYDVMEHRLEDHRRYRPTARALPSRDYMAYSPPRRGYHERSRSRERARLPPAPEVSTYDPPWRRAAAARRIEEEEWREREEAAQADLEMHMRRERVRNLEAAADEVRGRRYGRRGDWWP
ncbi:uncharacterized protein BKCO1_8100018 [Diplodia corticola]|uniref:Uncharacterized protein n=1 Tax=Diplodia corticola TaxID=236234 RepID=A0A1J9RAE9_9PEZI|nr:uncharacterized protein BKCO1_8100018 [Diplodia corticola]OJD29395.1 hypothetical protein BKCO1_8100018 [Diplodia corticola]